MARSEEATPRPLLALYDRTAGVDGWVSLEVSPLLAYDTQRSVEAARSLYAAASRPNLFIKIPGTKEGVPAIEEATFSGVPINVTLLFSREQYIASSEAYMRGLERSLRENCRPAGWTISGASSRLDNFDARPINRWSARTLNVVGEVCLNRFHNFARSILIELVEKPGENASQSIGPSVPTILPPSKAHVRSINGSSHLLHWTSGSRKTPPSSAAGRGHGSKFTTPSSNPASPGPRSNTLAGPS